jgi:hypothetical protein
MNAELSQSAQKLVGRLGEAAVEQLLEQES